VKPVTSCAGNSATVEVMLAARASMPVSISDGRVTNEPPPASAFCTPAHIAAMKRMMRAVIATFVLGRSAPSSERSESFYPRGERKGKHGSGGPQMMLREIARVGLNQAKSRAAR
jgi:hypothetical protein